MIKNYLVTYRVMKTGEVKMEKLSSADMIAKVKDEGVLIIDICMGEKEL